MKRKALIVVVGILFFICGGSLAGLCGEADNVSHSLIYGAIVDNYIQKCKAKAKFLDSRSYNIRKSATRATLKGAFLQSNRTAMITYLIKKDVPFNDQRIAYHLTLNFTESVHPQKIYAMLSEENL